MLQCSTMIVFFPSKVINATNEASEVSGHTFAKKRLKSLFSKKINLVDEWNL